jgi:four helix bundle protein
LIKTVNKEELQQRTKRFAIEIVGFVATFPRKKESDIIGHQLIRSGTSIGANYRSACRAQSRAHFISKMSIVLEESDESQYWLELADVFKWGNSEKRKNLLNEAKELTAIFTSSIKTAKSKQ